MTAATFDINSAMAQGVAIYNKGQFAEAEKVYQTILEHTPEHQEATLMLGVLAYERDDSLQAAELLRRAIALHPNPPAYYFLNLAMALNDQDQDDEALQAFSEAIRREPYSAKIHAKRGQLQHKMGRHSEALACYQTALQLDPAHTETHLLLGLLSEDLGRVENALSFYRTALSLPMPSSKVCTLLGNAFNRLGCETEARASYRLAFPFVLQKSEAGPSRLESNAVLRPLCKNLGGKVLSIGSAADRDREGGLYREYFPRASSYTRLDFDKRLFPDIVGDVQNLQGVIADGAYDVVLCLWALEHVPDAVMAIGEIHRLLAKNGWFIFGLPLNVEYHSFPHDYNRFTSSGIAELLSGRFHLAQIRPIGHEQPFDLDPRLRLFGEKTATAPHGFVGIAYSH